MKLHLVDTSDRLVSAWQRAFAAFPGVNILQRDILQVARNTLVSPANSYGYMDGGIDRVYRSFFGLEIERCVQDAIAQRPEGYLPIGSALLIPTGHGDIPYLLVAPTMILPGPVHAINSFYAMSAILQVASRYSDHIHDIYCPGLATGVGAVEPEAAAAEMAAAYSKWQHGREESTHHTPRDPL